MSDTDGWVQKKVRLIDDFQHFAAGEEGRCTADLPDHDVFAVWFAESDEWVRFQWSDRELFEVVDE